MHFHRCLKEIQRREQCGHHVQQHRHIHWICGICRLCRRKYRQHNLCATCWNSFVVQHTLGKWHHLRTSGLCDKRRQNLDCFRTMQHDRRYFCPRHLSLGLSEFSRGRRIAGALNVKAQLRNIMRILRSLSGHPDLLWRTGRQRWIDCLDAIHSQSFGLCRSDGDDPLETFFRSRSRVRWVLS